MSVRPVTAQRSDSALFCPSHKEPPTQRTQPTHAYTRVPAHAYMTDIYAPCNVTARVILPAYIDLSSAKCLASIYPQAVIFTQNHLQGRHLKIYWRGVRTRQDLLTARLALSAELMF